MTAAIVKNAHKSQVSWQDTVTNQEIEATKKEVASIKSGDYAGNGSEPRSNSN